jgi:hypothetical protein
MIRLMVHGARVTMCAMFGHNYTIWDYTPNKARTLLIRQRTCARCGHREFRHGPTDLT